MGNYPVSVGSISFYFSWIWCLVGDFFFGFKTMVNHQHFCTTIWGIPSRELTYPPKNGILKMIFLFPRWDMLIPWRVCFFQPPLTGKSKLFEKTNSILVLRKDMMFFSKRSTKSFENLETKQWKGKLFQKPSYSKKRIGILYISTDLDIHTIYNIILLCK